MKNHQQSLTESVITDVSYFSQNNQQKHKINVFCQFNNNATLLCENKKCSKPAFICEIKHCQCRKQHQKCYKLEIKSLLENIAQKQVFMESLEACINNGVQQIIDMLSTYREETITKMKKDFEFFGLSQNEKEFMQEVKEGKCKNVTGCKIWQIITSERERENITKMVEQTCKSLRSELQKSKKFFQVIVNNSNFTIEKLDSQVGKFLMVIQKEDTLIEKQFQLHQSKIMTSLDEFKVIESFFAPRTLKSVKLLYRASQNDFYVQKFHEKCDGVPATLTLVETQFRKKIGGYTPVRWNTHISGVWVSDQSMTSFLFSLTESDKFELTNKDKAVKNHSDRGPSFGYGADLYISDKANKKNSYANINCTYKNQKYQYQNKQSFQRFSGGESCYFNVKQWQVWGVVLE